MSVIILLLFLTISLDKVRVLANPCNPATRKIKRFGSSVVRALAMLAGDPGSIPGHATNFSNFSEGIGKPL